MFSAKEWRKEGTRRETDSSEQQWHFWKGEHNSVSKENLEYLNVESEDTEDKTRVKVWSTFLEKVSESCIQSIRGTSTRDAH